MGLKLQSPADLLHCPLDKEQYTCHATPRSCTVSLFPVADCVTRRNNLGRALLSFFLGELYLKKQVVKIIDLMKEIANFHNTLNQNA